jgi:hypothetical protein
MLFEKWIKFHFMVMVVQLAKFNPFVTIKSVLFQMKY